MGDLEGARFRKEIRVVVEHLFDAENTFLNRTERDRLVDEVLHKVLGLDPLELVLKDPSVSNILIHGPNNIYCERKGQMENSAVEFRDNQLLLQINYLIVSKVGRHVDETCPMVGARMADGSGFNAIFPLSRLMAPLFPSGDLAAIH